MIIREIIKNYLFICGYDGLYNNIKHCQCDKSKIGHCLNMDCQPGKYDKKKNICEVNDD